MRLRHPDGTTVHLSYCTNVHQPKDLGGVVAQLDRFAVPIRDRLASPALGLGLWLGADIARALAADPDAVRRLRAELGSRGLEVVTLNAFPYRGFQEPVVKKGVYSPDWAEPERLAYTLDAANVLARLLPDGVDEGSVSTLPLAWRDSWNQESAARARDHFADLATGLARLSAATGRTVRVGLEPEPGCVVSTVQDAAAKLGFLDTEWLGVCVDTCHLAVGFEDPRDALAGLDEAGLPIVKVQASCAMQARNPEDPATLKALSAYDEPRFLHQTTERGGAAADDLPEAVAGGLPGRAPWRIHYHFPLHAQPDPPLESTAPVLEAALDDLFGGPTPRTRHLEVETYTWPVLPGRTGGDAALAAGLAAELDWTRDRLAALGLEEIR